MGAAVQRSEWRLTRLRGMAAVAAVLLCVSDAAVIATIGTGTPTGTGERRVRAL